MEKRPMSGVYSTTESALSNSHISSLYQKYPKINSLQSLLSRS